MPPSSGLPSLESSSERSVVPAAGTVIMGKYRVTGVLGSGGMGSVIKAHHLLLDQPIAIKCLSPTALDSPAVMDRFSREARAAARIASEHVARVIDIAEFENGLPFIVMEYLDGEDLADHLQRVGPLRISTAVRFVLEACEVLAEAHAAGIIHRDIKPANLFLATQRDKRKIIKVLDFGISKVRDESLTNPSAMLGTLRYMSPEQLRSASDVDHRTDIWALGAVLYEMLTGVPPFDDSNGAVLMAAVFENNRLPVAELREDIPEDLAAIVEKCLETDRADRFATVFELARALSPFAKEGDRLSIDTIRRVLSSTLDSPVSSPLPSSGDPDGKAVASSEATSAPGTIVRLHDDADEMTETLLAKTGQKTGNENGKSGKHAKMKEGASSTLSSASSSKVSENLPAAPAKTAADTDDAPAAAAAAVADRPSRRKVNTHRSSSRKRKAPKPVVAETSSVDDDQASTPAEAPSQGKPLSGAVIVAIVVATVAVIAAIVAQSAK